MMTKKTHSSLYGCIIYYYLRFMILQRDFPQINVQNDFFKIKQNLNLNL